MEERFTRFEMPVDPNNIQAAAQALFDAVKAQMAAADQRKRGYTRAWAHAELEKLAQDEMAGGFAGPDQTYPIGSADDVRAAWALAAQAADPEAVRANIRTIALRCGWGAALPEGA